MTLLGKTLLTTLFFLAAAATTTPSVNGQTWTPVGPTGGDVRALASDPRNPRVVFLGTADGVLYRSDDAGRSWKRLSPGFPARGQSLDNVVVDTRGRVFVGYWAVAGTGGGVARSDDGGRSFSILRGIEGQSVRALAVAPSDPDILVVGAISGVFRSDDGGDNWARISPPNHLEIRNVESVAIDPSFPTVLYVGTWHLPWKTLDAGRTWRPIRVGMIDDSDVFTMTLDRRSSQTVYATACTGIYRSSDGAARWTKARGIPSSSRRTRSFAQDPDRPDTLYAGTTEGLFISDDGAVTWRLVTAKELIVNAILPMAVVHGGAILIGTDAAGVLRSTDGRTWTTSNEGFSEQLFSRVLFDRSSGRIVVGVFGDPHHSGVLQAARPEGPWTRVGYGLEGREVLAVALDDGDVLAGTNEGVFRASIRAGRWWRLPTIVDGTDTYPRVVDLAVLPGRVILAATSHGILRSADGGVTWQRRWLGLAGAVSAVAASPNNPRLALAATPFGTFRTRDAGLVWEQVSKGLSGLEIHTLAFMPGNDDLVFAATAAGLLKSADQGKIWQRRGSGLPLSDVAGLALAPDGRTLYASDFTNGGLYRSSDAGETWHAFPSAGLPSDRVWTVALDPATPGRMLAATSTGGLHLLAAGSSGAAAGAR